jgi:hypothetical protein
LGCAIFGITEVPTDGVEFDTGDQAGETSSAEPPIIPVPPSNQPTVDVPMGASYSPPPATEDAVVSGPGWDPEMGEARKAFISTEGQSSGSAIHGLTATLSPPLPDQTQVPPVDLLDSNPSAEAPQADTIGGSLHELD